ncbi:hypothetical protein LTR53_016071 [Teratosphaeriaceae sp. CCFEE 6253]|nr:hypothetical protein LTR53_016071 [Teratosphaeriaceae sp. CCFEE 6253]
MSPITCIGLVGGVSSRECAVSCQSLPRWDRDSIELYHIPSRVQFTHTTIKLLGHKQAMAINNSSGPSELEGVWTRVEAAEIQKHANHQEAAEKEEATEKEEAAEKEEAVEMEDEDTFHDMLDQWLHRGEINLGPRPEDEASRTDDLTTLGYTESHCRKFNIRLRKA